MAVSVGREYLDRAHSCLKQAEDCHRQLDWPLCILRAAECVEFSLKGILQAVGLKYKREHDLSGYLPGAHEHFPDWFKEKIPRMAMISRTLTQLSLFAKYGDEVLGASPRRLFEQAEATVYLDNARQVFWACNSVLGEIQARAALAQS